MSGVVYVAPIAGQALGFFASTAGAPTFSQSNLRSGGGDTLCECAAVTANTHIGDPLPASTRQLALSGYFCAHLLPLSGSQPILLCNGPASTPQIKLDSAGQLHAVIGATNISGPTVVADQWFRLDVLFDTSGTTYSISWYVNGGFATTATLAGQTAADMTSYNAGWCTASGTATIRLMDLVYSVTAADFPLGGYITKLAALTGCGTHSLGAGAFKKTGAVAITAGEVTSYTEIDEMPPSNTDFVEQTAIDATHYCEYTVTAVGTAPNVVCALAGFQGAAANAYTMQVRLYDGTTEGSDTTSTVTKSGTTARFSATQLATNPSGSAWATSLARMRFGYSSDVTPNPMLNSMGLVYAYPQPAPPATGSLPIAGVW